MFGIPDQAIGAIAAALIAGLISLLGLIISKEQKVSDFRQAWIDALTCFMHERCRGGLLGTTFEAMVLMAACSVRCGVW